MSYDVTTLAIFDLHLISFPITLFSLDNLFKMGLLQTGYNVRFHYLVVDPNCGTTPDCETHPTKAYLEL